MNIHIICENSNKDFSGGRIHAWTIAEALALEGVDVNFITNNIPVFYSDFNYLKNHDDIKVTLSELEILDELNMDSSELSFLESEEIKAITSKEIDIKKNISIINDIEKCVLEDFFYNSIYNSEIRIDGDVSVIASGGGKAGVRLIDFNHRHHCDV